MSQKQAEKLIERLLELPDDWDEEVDEIIDALVELGEPAIKPMIYQFLAEPNLHYPMDNTEEIASAFGRMGDAALKALIQALDDSNPHIRDGATWVLGEIRNPNAVEALAKVLWEQKSPTAIISLGKIGGEQAAENLLKALERGHFEKRFVITWLGNTGSNSVFDTLIHALNDKDRDVRHAALYSLAELNKPQVIDPLVSALNDQDDNVRRTAAYLLATHYNDPRAAHVFAEDFDSNKRVPAMGWIAQSGNTEYVEQIYSFFASDRELIIRLSAANALILLETKYDNDAVQLIEKSLNSKDLNTRFETLRSISGMKHRFAEKWLLSFIHDSNDYLRYCAAIELSKQGTSDVLSLMEGWLAREQHRLVKKAVIRAIEMIESRDS